MERGGFPLELDLVRGVLAWLLEGVEAYSEGKFGKFFNMGRRKGL